MATRWGDLKLAVSYLLGRVRLYEQHYWTSIQHANRSTKRENLVLKHLRDAERILYTEWYWYKTDDTARSQPLCLIAAQQTKLLHSVILSIIQSIRYRL